MRAKFLTTMLVASLSSWSAFAGVSDNSKIASGDALLLGGTQPGWIDIDGQNRGDTEIELIFQNDERAKVVAIVAPGDSFIQSVPRDRALVIRNTSEIEPARVYWHISRYSKSANARFLSDEK